MTDRCKQIDLALHGGGLAIVLSSIGAAWWLVYQPLETARGAAKARCAEINELLQSADRLRAEQGQLKRSLADARLAEQRLLARVPDEAHEADFLRQISRLAKDVGLELRDYRPGHAQSRPTCSAMEVTLNCEGNYEALCRFLDGVGNLPRLVRLSQIEIGNSRTEGAYTAMLKLVIYFAAKAKAPFSDPEGVKFHSPGRSPGYRSRLQSLALKGRYSSGAFRKVHPTGMTPFQGYSGYVVTYPGLRPGLWTHAPSGLQRPSALSIFPESGTISDLGGGGTKPASTEAHRKFFAHALAGQASCRAPAHQGRLAPERQAPHA